MTWLSFADFAYEPGADFTALKSAGLDGVLMYLSDTPGKGMTRASLAAALDAGLIVGALYETSATAALGGRNTGVAQATAAIRIAKSVGYPITMPIIFALDADFSTAQMAGPVSEFVKGLHSVPGPDGEYGGFKQLSYLIAHNLADRGRLFQTYAWSNGQWLPTADAPAEQYQNGATVGGITLDRTRVTPAFAATLLQPGGSPVATLDDDDKTWLKNYFETQANFHRLASTVWHDAQFTPQLDANGAPVVPTVYTESASARSDRVDALAKYITNGQFTTDLLAALPSGTGGGSAFSLDDIKNALGTVIAGIRITVGS